MKMDSVSEPIHVLSENPNVWNLIEDVAFSGDQENPFYICNIDDIIKKYSMWKTAMPRIKPHYAVKCNYHPAVLRVLASLGIGFDCASKTEIEKVLSLGVDTTRIIFAHTTKPPSHILYAAQKKVDLMTFDNELELYKIKNLYPTARTVIRIKYDAKVAMAALGLKFGCDPNTEAPHLLKIADDLGINVVGVSFHVGSGCSDPSAFHGAIEAARQVFDVAATLGYKFDLLDIGGGYPGEFDETIKEYAKVINQAVDEFFPDESIRIISEPGTYFVDSAFTLACSIHSSKKVTAEDPVTGDSSTEYRYYLNDGAFGSLSSVISYNVLKIPKPLKKYPDSKTYPSILWGPTCDSKDKIVENILLPKMNLGDWLVFFNMGAYTIPLWTPFNGFEEPNVYSVISLNNWLLLRKSSPFIEQDFVKEYADTYPETDLKIPKNRHYDFRKCTFVRG